MYQPSRSTLFFRSPRATTAARSLIASRRAAWLKRSQTARYEILLVGTLGFWVFCSIWVVGHQCLRAQNRQIWSHMLEKAHHHWPPGPGLLPSHGPSDAEPFAGFRSAGARAASLWTLDFSHPAGCCAHPATQSYRPGAAFDELRFTGPLRLSAKCNFCTQWRFGQ